MNRLFACFVLTLALLLGATLAAQEKVVSAVPSSDRSVERGCLSVQGGDSLWRIADRVMQDPTLWERIYESNPFLQKPGRRYVNPANGWTFVLIKPGEQLCGLEELGLFPELASTADLAAMGFNPPKPETVTVEKISSWSYYLPLGILLLVALALAALYAFFRRDPTRVGQGRVVESGIEDPARAADHFRSCFHREAVTEAVAAGRFREGQPYQARIISMVRGRAYGWARVADSAGSLFRRLLRGEPVWEVTAQMPDGRQVIRYTLIACANDIRAGGGMIPGFGFRFVAEENVTDRINPVQPALTPETAPAPAPAPVPAETGIVAPQSPEDRDEVIELREADDEGDELVRLTNIPADRFTFRRGHTAAGVPTITFRFRRERREGAPGKN